MKKFIAIAVAALMLLSVVPFTAFAADGDPIKIVDAEGNDVATYASLQDAFNAVTNTQKIVVLEDIELASWLQYKSTYDKENLRTVVIEGAEKSDDTKVKITCAKGFSDQVGLYNLTVRNLEIVNTATATFDVFMYDPYCGGWVSDFSSPTLTIDNCAVSSGYGVFKFAAQPTSNLIEHNPFIVNIKDSTVTAKGGSDRGIGYTLWNQAASVDMNIVNSTLKLDGGRSASNNPELSYLFTHQAGIAAATFDLSVDGTSKLIANVTNTDNVTAGIYYGHSGSSIVTLAQGAELYVDSGENKTSNYFVWSRSVSPLTFTDNGAIYKASATTVKNGITLPTFVDSEEKNHLWVVDGEAVTNPYYNANATTDIVFTHTASDNPALDPNNIGYYELDGEKIYFTDMKSAIAAAPQNTTFEVVRDFSVNGFIQWFGKNVTIDGNGHTITGTHSSYVFDINKASSGSNPTEFTFTLRDTNVVGKAGFWFNTNYINIEDCTFNTVGYMGMSNDGVDGTRTIINITRTEWNFVTSGVRADAQPFMLMGTNKDNDIIFNIEDSKIIGASGNGTSASPNTPNNGFFNMNTKGEIEFNVDSTSVIKATADTTGSIFAFSDSSGVQKFTLNLEDGATIAMESCMANSSFIATPIASEKMFINDDGANWVLGANALANGAKLPTVTIAGKTMLGWSDGTNLIKAGAAYTVADATEAKNFTSVFFDTADFAMEYGASLRTQKGSGIRFRTNVSAELKALLGNNVSFGTLISRVTNVGPTLETAAEDLVVIARTQWANDEETLYSAALINIPDTAKAYDIKIAGRGYMTVTYANGTETFYTDYTEEANARSIREIATNLLAKHNATEGEDASFELDAATLALVNTIIATM